MITIADNQEFLAREVALEARQEARIVALAHRLPAQIFVDLRHRVARVAPARGGELGMKRILPGEVVCGQIDIEKHRTLAALALDHAEGGIEVEPVRLERVAAQHLAVDEVRDADTLVI